MRIWAANGEISSHISMLASQFDLPFKLANTPYESHLNLDNLGP